MAVVIQNMKIPESCANCIFYDDNWDYPTCSITNHTMGYNFNIFIHRMPDCEIDKWVEVTQNEDNVKLFLSNKKL